MTQPVFIGVRVRVAQAVVSRRSHSRDAWNQLLGAFSLGRHKTTYVVRRAKRATGEEPVADRQTTLVRCLESSGPSRLGRSLWLSVGEGSKITLKGILPNPPDRRWEEP
jgi:hypothetical protein